MGNQERVHQKKRQIDTVLFYSVKKSRIMATKHKSHSGAKKRFKKTAKGKLMFKKSCNSHLLTNKGKNHKAFPY